MVDVQQSSLPTYIHSYLERSITKLKYDNPYYNNHLYLPLRKPFYSVLYHLFKRYNRYMWRNSDGCFVFGRDQFVEKAHRGQTKKFIEIISGSQMVDVFLMMKEVEFSKQGNINCQFLSHGQKYCDAIIMESNRPKSRYHCPVCMQSTFGRASLEFSGYIVHQKCFVCGRCGMGLHRLEREKIIIKSNDFQPLKLYCANCRRKNIVNLLIGFIPFKSQTDSVIGSECGDGDVDIIQCWSKSKSSSSNTPSSLFTSVKLKFKPSRPYDPVNHFKPMEYHHGTFPMYIRPRPLPPVPHQRRSKRPVKALPKVPKKHQVTPTYRGRPLPKIPSTIPTYTRIRELPCPVYSPPKAPFANFRKPLPLPPPHPDMMRISTSYSLSNSDIKCRQ
ncbi:hypothetical protein SAMD00019534_026930 [Acytostelium subglobosum LB1]|uniref:hypothetical protein n=1 Tax=Acytostelium subglobosum LB1 TaxID=1410327 RepID=UPI000644D0FE|nr:hypothetical protein SAMD00019534_026930 [Acytostelium subglobosum LB1]GAM19518.1 hypothetical protein SAMD00019534_026930 [Acytostelium subglobosum LB1]|eukprot:XP_012757445.1 hypothetical protein SAMD00019534_026930 [Acytostelium subglobosum LB1]